MFIVPRYEKQCKKTELQLSIIFLKIINQFFKKSQYAIRQKTQNSSSHYRHSIPTLTCNEGKFFFFGSPLTLKCFKNSPAWSFSTESIRNICKFDVKTRFQFNKASALQYNYKLQPWVKFLVCICINFFGSTENTTTKVWSEYFVLKIGTVILIQSTYFCTVTLKF